jgi:hypothetical protein
MSAWRLEPVALLEPPVPLLTLLAFAPAALHTEPALKEV